MIQIKSEFDEQAEYIGLKSNDLIEVPIKNSALLLQNLLEKKLAMQPHDKDMIVMLHEIDFEIDGGRKEIRSCLIVKGDDQQRTAMAKTVGLPLGIAAKLILQDKIKLRGLQIPVAKEIYEPVLAELELHQIKFNEEFVMNSYIGHCRKRLVLFITEINGRKIRFDDFNFFKLGNLKLFMSSAFFLKWSMIHCCNNRFYFFQ